VPRIRSATDVGAIVRSARLRRHMTQSDLAVAAGVSRRWIVDLEAGKPRAELGLVLAVLETLGTPLTVEAPEPPSPGDSAPPSAALDLDEHLRRLAADE